MGPHAPILATSSVTFEAGNIGLPLPGFALRKFDLNILTNGCLALFFVKVTGSNRPSLSRQPK